MCVPKSDLELSFSGKDPGRSLGGQKIRHDPNPVYLGITLDRSLAFHDHLRKTAAKTDTCNNLLSMLAGSSWGASAPTLRTSALALCYSVAEYCAPVWSRSTHTHTWLTPSFMKPCASFLEHCMQPHYRGCQYLVTSLLLNSYLRRQEATAKLLTTIQLSYKLPCVCSDINSHSSVRLLTRHPVW